MRLLGQVPGRFKVEIDLDLVGQTDLIGVCAHCGGEALVAQDDRLDVEGEVAQRADRLAVAVERRCEHTPGIVESL